jgi:acyl-CoA thioesterase
MRLADDAVNAQSLEKIPFMADLGVEFVSMGDGQAELALKLAERHMNSWQMLHGGVTMALLDAVMSMAGRSLSPEARAGVTVEMKTSFMRPGGAPGARIIARGKALHNSLTLCFCEGEIWDGDKLVAKASGTFKYMRRLDIAKKPKLNKIDE